MCDERGVRLVVDRQHDQVLSNVLDLRSLLNSTPLRLTVGVRPSTLSPASTVGLVVSMYLRTCWEAQEGARASRAPAARRACS